MLEFLPRPLYRRLYASGFPAFVARAGIAWRFLWNRSTERDGYDLTRAGEEVTGIYGFDCVSVADLVECLEDRHGPLDDERRDVAKSALERVVSKWDSSGDARGALLDWAEDKFREYCEQDGIVLPDLYEDEGEAA